VSQNKINIHIVCHLRIKNESTFGATLTIIYDTSETLVRFSMR